MVIFFICVGKWLRWRDIFLSFPNCNHSYHLARHPDRRDGLRIVMELFWWPRRWRLNNLIPIIYLSNSIDPPLMISLAHLFTCLSFVSTGWYVVWKVFISRFRFVRELLQMSNSSSSNSTPSSPSSNNSPLMHKKSQWDSSSISKMGLDFRIGNRSFHPMDRHSLPCIPGHVPLWNLHCSIKIGWQIEPGTCRRISLSSPSKVEQASQNDVFERIFIIPTHYFVIMISPRLLIVKSRFPLRK